MKRKLIGALLALSLVFTCFTACSAPAKTEKNSSLSAGGSSAATETLFNPSFSIEELENGIKKVTDGEERELILVPKELKDVPSEYSDSTVVRTPVENAVFLSSTQVCTFRTIDNEEILDSIGGVAGNKDMWNDIPGIKERMEKGAIIDVGGDGMSGPDFELIQSLNPEIVFVYGGSSPQSNEMEKLEELGINYAVDNEYMENNYLARMEWMRFIITFYNADSDADAVMQKAEKNVNALKDQIKDMEKPTVAVFSVFDGMVYPTNNKSWVGSMLSDMGGVNAFSDINEQNITLEKAYEIIENSDIVVYTATPSYCSGIDEITDAFPQLKECKAYKNKTIYQYTDLFWNGIDQSDIMAGDLAAVINPSAFKDRTLNYFIKLEY